MVQFLWFHKHSLELKIKKHLTKI